MKLWKKLLLSLVVISVVLAAYLFVQIRALEVESLSDDLHVIRGIGGNVTVLKTGHGNVIVDSMTFPMQGKLIRAKAKQLTGEDTTVLINTHYHLDHTHGNPGFVAGTRVISTEKTLSHLKFFDADFWEDENSLIPHETISDQTTLNVGNKTLVLFSPGAGHTDGDLVVIIKQENTAVLGDLMFNQHYPNIDLEAGGSVQQWPATLERVMAESFQQVIPGHGPTTNRVGVDNFKRFMQQLATIGSDAAANDTPLDAVLQSTKLTADKGFTPIRFAGISLGLNREFVLRRSWEESTGNFELKN